MQRLTLEEYLKIDAESASGLKNLAESPFYYQYRKTQQKSTDAMFRGTATHAAVFEPEFYSETYTTWHSRRSGKAWDRFQEETVENGKKILTLSMRDDVDAMASAVRKHPLAAKLLSAGVAEKTITWVDPLTGRKFRAKLDWLTDTWILVDLKTARDVLPRRFTSNSAELLYHMQMAIYFDGITVATGRSPSAVKIIAVESTAPHRVVVYDVPGIVLEYGQFRYRQLLDLLEKCEASGEWPDIGAKEQTLTLPAWATNEDEDVAITSGGVSLF